MRFVAGRDAVAKLLQAGNRWHRGQPAGAVKRSSIGKSLPLHGRRCGCIGKPTNAHKREGPGRDLNISPEPLLFIALRKGNTPCDEAEPPFTAGMHCRRSCRRHSSLAFTAGMHCRRSCRRHSPLAFTAGMQCWHSPPAFSAGAVAAAIMQGLQGRLQQMQELRRALGIRQG